MPLLLIFVTVSGLCEDLAFKTCVSGCQRFASPGWLISPPSVWYSSSVDPWPLMFEETEKYRYRYNISRKLKCTHFALTK